MTNAQTKLYASQGNGGKATVSVAALGTAIGGSIPAATTTTNGTVKQAADVTTSTATDPTPAPAGGTGAAAGGWDTAPNRDIAIATINANRTLALELQTKVNGILTALKAAGIMA